MAQNIKRPTTSPSKTVIEQKQLRLNQPHDGRLDVDVAKLKEGRNVVCKHPKTGKSLVAIVKKGEIVGWELEEATNKRNANARTAAPTTTAFSKNATRQYKISRTNKQSRVQEIAPTVAVGSETSSGDKSAARGFISTTVNTLPLGINCTNITCSQCFTYNSTCDRCKDCPTNGTKDPPIMVAEGSGVGIEEYEELFSINQWSGGYDIYTYDYSYTSYITLQSSTLFSQMGW